MFGKAKVQKMDVTEWFYAAIKTTEKVLVCAVKDISPDSFQSNELYSMNINIVAKPGEKSCAGDTAVERREFRLHCKFKLASYGGHGSANVILYFRKISTSQVDLWDDEHSYAQVRFGSRGDYFFVIEGLFSEPRITERASSSQVGIAKCFETG
ncbi:MAG: hypothetical protein HYW15_03225 [Candidatus Giovannonibacteria bacterium]|nr:MAG: hypothetical protein HYW15_03225 [Candidatus Giovannonibacteria bacterium]